MVDVRKVVNRRRKTMASWVESGRFDLRVYMEFFEVFVKATASHACARLSSWSHKELFENRELRIHGGNTQYRIGRRAGSPRSSQRNGAAFRPPKTSTHKKTAFLRYKNLE